MQIKHLASFPCSGRTWLLAMVGGALGEDLEKWMTNADFFFPDYHTRFIANHVYTNFFFRDGPYSLTLLDGPIAMMSRNPWDTMVSYWHHMAHRGYYGDGNPDFTLKSYMPDDQSLSAFLRDYRFGVDAWSKWDDHVWAQLEDGRDIYFTYRDLVVSPRDVLESFTSWLIPGFPSWDIDRGLEFGDFDKMKNSEISHLKATSSNPESGKVRRGKVGGFVDYMSDEDIKYVCDNINERQFLEHNDVLKGDMVWQ